MIPFSNETLLLALAWTLYLYDGSVLLFSNEALLTTGGARRWSLDTGFTGFMLAGRSLCILNPFTPHRASFRLRWNFKAADLQPADVAWSLKAELLSRLRITTWISASALLVLLPVGLLSSLGVYAVVPALVLLYGSAIAGLMRLRSMRRDFGLEGARYAGFIFECLACPPFAANMIRRIAIRQQVSEALPSAGARLLPVGEWDRLRAHCELRLDSEMQRLDESSQERAELDAAKRALGALSVSP